MKNYVYYMMWETFQKKDDLKQNLLPTILMNFSFYEL